MWSSLAKIGVRTWVTRMVPSAPVFLWNASISRSGNSQMTSLRSSARTTLP